MAAERRGSLVGLQRSRGRQTGAEDAAGDLGQSVRNSHPDTEARAAAQAMSAGRLPGLIVCGDDGRPYTILPGSQVLRFLIPDYLQDTPAVARVLDEQASEVLCRRLEHTTVRDLLPHPRDIDELPWSTEMPRRWRWRRCGGQDFYDINPTGQVPRGADLFEIRFVDGTWMVAIADDLALS